VTHGAASSATHPIQAGVPQNSVLGPVLHLLFTADIPVPESTSIVTATFADDTAVLATGEYYETATGMLQAAPTSIANWTRKWKLVINARKSVHVDFALRPHSYQPIYIENRLIPHSTHAKYLGIFLDQRLNYQTHVKAK